MGRTKARLIAILGVAIALALPPRMALAKSWIPVSPDTFEYYVVGVTFDGSSYQSVNSDFSYPLLPYSAPYVDTTSSDYGESGSAHSDVLMTEQTYSLTLSQLDNGELRVSLPSRFYSFGSNNTYHWNVTSSTANGFGGGTYTIPNTLHDPGGYSYLTTHTYRDGYGYVAGPIEDFMSVGEHDSTGEVATDYASEGSSTGLVTHVMPLGDGLWSSVAPLPSVSSDGNRYFALMLRGSGSINMGVNGRPFRGGDYWRFFNSYYSYWSDEVFSTTGTYKNPFNATFCGFIYGNNANGLSVGTPNSDGLFSLSDSALIFGLLFRVPNNATSSWSERIISFYPSLYLIDMETEVTIREETQSQTEEMMDTTGSGSIFSGLLDVATDTLENNTGFLGQLASITDTYNSIIADSSGSGLVMFPGVTVLGVQLIEPQNVSLFQGALSQFTEPVRMVWTFIFVTAWINGMKHLWEVQVLGYASDGELARRARIEMDMDPDIPF